MIFVAHPTVSRRLPVNQPLDCLGVPCVKGGTVDRAERVIEEDGEVHPRMAV
jgi:hypothetical protein